MVCLLTPNRYASYTVPVRQYRSLQSRFLHCCRHQQPACDLLMLSRYIGTHKGFAPSGKKIYPRTIGILKKICIFDILTDLRWWVHCSCRAHTSCIKHLAVSGLSSVSARIKSSCNLIGNRFEMPNVSYTRPLPATLRATLQTTNRQIKMIDILSKWTIILFGIFFICVGLLMLFNPKKANDILRKAGSTNFINYAEITTRIIPAVGLILSADNSKYPDIFKIFGWFMLLTSLVLYFVPRQLHHNFSLKAADILKPIYFQLISPFAFLIGTWLIYSVI